MMTISTIGAASPVTLLIRGNLPAGVLSQLYGLVEAAGGLVKDQSVPQLTTDQQRVLAALATSEGELTSVEVAKLTGISRGSVRCHLARLVSVGLAARRWGPKGNSETYFAATDAGRRSAA